MPAVNRKNRSSPVQNPFASSAISTGPNPAQDKLSLLLSSSNNKLVKVRAISSAGLEGSSVAQVLQPPLLTCYPLIPQAVVPCLLVNCMFSGIVAAYISISCCMH